MLAKSVQSFLRFGRTELFQSVLPCNKELELQNLLSKKQSFYLGVDPTADGLQIGNLFPIIASLKLRSVGHKALFIVGGATGKVGDPTDRESDRELIIDSEINTNAMTVKNDLERIIRNCDLYYNKGCDVVGEWTILNNEEWFQNVNIMYFLDNVLKHYRLNDIKDKKSFESRFNSEQSITMKEMLYPFLQAYDWLFLYQKFGCKVQIGGDDQQGNMVIGQSLINAIEKDNVYGLTVPLFTVNGVKLGKSLSNSLFINRKYNFWLNSEKQMPFLLYSNIILISHKIILENGLLERLTMLDQEERESIMAQNETNKASLMLQKVLGYEIIKLVYGEDAANLIRLVYELFHPTESDSTVNEILSVLEKSSQLQQYLSYVPHFKLSDADYNTEVYNWLSNALQSINQIYLLNTDKFGPIKFNGSPIDVKSTSLKEIVYGNSLIKGVLEIGSKNKWIVCLQEN